MSGQLYTLDALPVGKERTPSNHWKEKWTTELIWTFWCLNPGLSSLFLGHCTNITFFRKSSYWWLDRRSLHLMLGTCIFQTGCSVKNWSMDSTQN